MSSVNNIPSGGINQPNIPGKTHEQANASDVNEFEAQMKDGVFEGPYIRYHLNKNIWQKGTFLNDQVNGTVDIFDETGKLIGRDQTKDGKTDGLSKRFYPNGEIKSITEFSMNIKSGSRSTFYESGALQCKAEYKNDIIDGKSICFYENGLTKTIGSYSEGTALGVFKFFDENGEVISEEKYHNGDLIQPIDNKIINTNHFDIRSI